jgi:hypothetical protein
MKRAHASRGETRRTMRLLRRGQAGAVVEPVVQPELETNASEGGQLGSRHVSEVTLPF